MNKELSLIKWIYIYWIAPMETAKLVMVATNTVRDMETYARKQDLPESMKNLVPSVLTDLVAGRKHYDFIHAIIDAAVEKRVSEFRGSQAFHTYCREEDWQQAGYSTALQK